MAFQTCFGVGEERTTTWQPESSPRVNFLKCPQIESLSKAVSVANLGMGIERYSEEIARYRMIKHKPEKPNKMRWSLLKSSKRRFVIGVFENLIISFSREE